jgi:hypothetical protein
MNQQPKDVNNKKIVSTRSVVLQIVRGTAERVIIGKDKHKKGDFNYAR